MTVHMHNDHQDEVIVIVLENPESAKKLEKDIGVDNGRLELITKYFTAYPSVVVVSSIVELDLMDSATVKAIICDSREIMNSSFAETMSEDSIRIFYTASKQYLEECIDTGFELVLSASTDGEDATEVGPTRVRAALECRMWVSADDDSAETPLLQVASQDDIVESFDVLMEKIKSIRDASISHNTSDAQRRAMAEALANELAGLLGSDSDCSED